MAHTPAPWSISTAKLGDQLCTIRAKVDGYEKDQKIASVVDLGTQGDANARLIAAAPELLFALQYALPFIPAGAITNEAYDNGGKSVANVVRAAIAKATGGAE